MKQESPAIKEEVSKTAIGSDFHASNISEHDLVGLGRIWTFLNICTKSLPRTFYRNVGGDSAIEKKLHKNGGRQTHVLSSKLKATC